METFSDTNLKQFIEKIYLCAFNNDHVAFDTEIQKIPKEKIPLVLGESMNEAFEKCISMAEFKQTANFILQKGADINYVRVGGMPIITQVLNRKMWEVAEWLLSFRPNLSFKDYVNKKSCLHILIELAGNDTRLLKLLHLLLTQGANPNDMDSEGNTPLHKACEKTWTDAVRLLIQSRADPNYQNSQTWDTPLHVIARMKGLTSVDCAKELISQGAFLKNLNNKQRTPIDEANIAGNSEMLKLLTEKAYEQEYYFQQQQQQLAYQSFQMSMDPYFYQYRYPPQFPYRGPDMYPNYQMINYPHIPPIPTLPTDSYNCIF